jgi:hypothetical protein
MGQKQETLQFLPPKSKKMKYFLESTKTIDKKFFLKRPKRFLNYYTHKYELERA